MFTAVLFTTAKRGKQAKGQQNVVPPHSDDYFTTLPHGQTLRHAAEREKPGTNDRVSHDFLPMKFQNGQIQRQKDNQGNLNVGFILDKISLSMIKFLSMIMVLRSRRKMSLFMGDAG